MHQTNIHKLKVIVGLLIISFSSLAEIPTQLIIPEIIGNGMVLQRDTEVVVWGYTVQSRSVSINPIWASDVTILSDNEWRFNSSQETIVTRS
ncbi:MAG: hypothetical protein JXR07_10455 [Reichenbachiella sp.]